MRIEERFLVYSNYKDIIKNYPVLSKEEEQMLFRRLEKGSDKVRKLVRERLIFSNIRLVFSILNKYLVPFLGKSLLPYEDLFNEGVVGLMTAVERFDYRRNLRFSTYASFWIYQTIARAVLEKVCLKRVPINKIAKLNRYRRIARSFQENFSRLPSDRDMARRLRVTRQEAMILRELLTGDVQLFSQHESNDDNDHGNIDINAVADGSLILPEDWVSRKDLSRILHQALQSLRPLEAQVIKLRYGLGNGEKFTLEQVGELIGKTRERVRQIEVVAKQKLKDNLQLKTYIS